ncbi:MAG TPA: D-glycerate dehydrogenase [Anaeromyxobacteraceae bacterium]|nr:D-glycerate dehydrogenase [Anaeromyxobacteraceae bacterium]
MKPVLYFVRALPGADLSRVSELFEVRGGAARPPRREQLVEEARDATVLVPTYIDRVDAELLAALPRLRQVASYGVGVNHIDLEACRARGILVTNTPGVVTEATADLAFGLVLAVARRIAESDRLVRRGGWTGIDPGWMLGTEVNGKTLGIVGFGRIGQAVARRATGFSMRVLYATPRDIIFNGAERRTLEAILAESDIVSLHVPLTPATRNLIDRERIRAMKPGAILVNTARGGVVDEAALADALSSGHLGGAGVDVFADEPHVPEALLRLENVVMTPHLGSGTRETRAAMSRMVLDEIDRVARGGGPIHEVV